MIDLNGLDGRMKDLGVRILVTPREITDDIALSRDLAQIAAEVTVLATLHAESMNLLRTVENVDGYCPICGGEHELVKGEAGVFSAPTNHTPDCRLGGLLRAHEGTT